MKKLLLLLAFIPFIFAGTISPQDSLSFLAGSAVDFSRLNMSVSTVGDTDYIEIEASLAAEAKRIKIFDSGGIPLFLATGAAGLEVDKFIIIPGGGDDYYLQIPAATRIAVRTASTGAIVSGGELIMNYFGQ